MKLYFDSVRINELRQNYWKIAPLFSTEEQDAMSIFLSDVEQNGCCDIEKYNNVYSILNNIANRSKKRRTHGKNRKRNLQNDNQANGIDVDEKNRIIDLIRFQFSMKYFFAPDKGVICEEQNNQLLKK